MVLDPLCSCSSCCSKDKKNRLCGSLVPDLRGDRYQSASQKYSGKTKAFCGNRSSDPYDHQTEGFLFSVRSHHSILCRCSGNASDASEEIRNPGSSPGSTGGIFQTVSWVHYPTDVLAGFVIALVGSTLSVWIVRTKPEDKQVH